MALYDNSLWIREVAKLAGRVMWGLIFKSCKIVLLWEADVKIERSNVAWAWIGESDFDMCSLSNSKGEEIASLSSASNLEGHDFPVFNKFWEKKVM